MKHQFTINSPSEKVPGKVFPDGAISGNGDLSVVWGGTTDRVRLYLGKCDFWKADGNALQPIRGGVEPLGIIEILLPQFPHAPYRVEQDMDHARLTGYYQYKHFDATLTVTVCACENTVLLELDRTFPGLSASLNLLPLEGNEAAVETGEMGDMHYSLRGFDTENTDFPTFGMCACREISRICENGRERIRWAVCVGTNHDTAAYRKQTPLRLSVIDNKGFEERLNAHDRWWQDFWAKSGVSLPDKDLENHWCMGIYAMACCARNKKFPPGLWGNFGTADGQAWSGDYHLNYNFQAPFYALFSSNHPELTDCYLSPLLDFLPKAKSYAKHFLGCRGAYFPVAIGPLGMESGLRSWTKEHGHSFLGQKSNGAYTAVIPMMRWYSTYDKEYAKSVYPYLCEVGDFWEDYLTFEDGRYVIYNDYLHEAEFWSDPDFVPPQGTFDQVNPILSLGLVRAVMKLLLDMSEALGIDEGRREKRQHILDRLSEVKTVEKDGVPVLLEAEYEELKLDPLSLRYVYPAEQIGKYSTPELYQTAKNTLEMIGAWEHGNQFCEYYHAAARLEYDPKKLIDRIRENIEKHQMPNGLFAFVGGGIENCAAIPGTVNEMLLQSNEHILRFFPCWDRTRDASFHGLRAYGAFVVDGSVKNGEIRAEIRSEQGVLLRLERPGEDYGVLYRGETIPLTDLITNLETVPGEKITLFRISK
ncbi:MAG: hypothetical protein J6B86_00960 [Clostridia bacterium]|nr:hypothetical protein [Clostridia bacterium]